MRYLITNNSPGRRGFWSRGRLVWVDPKQQSVIDMDNVREANRPGLVCEPAEELPPPPAGLAEVVAKMDHDGDGIPGGSKAPKHTAELKALRAEYQKKMGKRPFPGWGVAEIKRRMGDA